MCRKVFGLMLSVLIAGTSMSQPINSSLSVTLPDAEKIFLQKNLSLLTQQYSIDINKALVQQAKYWDNPVLSTDQDLYDGRFFRHKEVDGQPYGQIYFQLQEVIRTADKRNKLIQIARDQTLSAEQQFNDLMRNLKFTLSTDFNELYELNATNKVYNNEISAMQKLVAGMEEQWKVGNISQKENVRVKSLLFSLQSDQAEVQRQVADLQKELRVLLRGNNNSTIVPVINNMNKDSVELSIAQLIDSANNNRPDLQLARTGYLTQQHNLSYQKALKIPDVTVGLEYDRINSYVRNYWGLTLGVPLPLFNRNRGNIIAAETSVRQSASVILQTQVEVEQEVTAAFNKYLIARNLKNSLGTELGSSYDTLLQNMITGYQQRQVSLIEFIDFFDSYKETTIKKLQQQTALRNAMAELNFTTGSPVILIQ